MNRKNLIALIFAISLVPVFAVAGSEASAVAVTTARSKCLRILKVVASPILFEAHVEVKPNIRGYGFFVERPRDKDSWAQKIWRHYPRKISKWMIGDDSYVFMPLNPFPGRQLVWLYDFASGDWLIKRISKFFVGAPYVLSRYVTIPLTIWTIANLAYANYNAPPDVVNLDPPTTVSAEGYQFLPTDKAIVPVPHAQITESDIRAQMYHENGGDPKNMQDTFSHYYAALEKNEKVEPTELFSRVDRLAVEVGKPERREQAVEATHMLYFRLRLLDELYYFPTLFNKQKRMAIDKHEVELSEFMNKIQLSDNFLLTARSAYLDGHLSEDEFLRFSQLYIYNLYILELADVLDQNLVKERFGVSSPLNLLDMTISLKAQLAGAMKERAPNQSGAGHS